MRRPAARDERLEGGLERRVLERVARIFDRDPGEIVLRLRVADLHVGDGGARQFPEPLEIALGLREVQFRPLEVALERRQVERREQFALREGRSLGDRKVDDLPADLEGEIDGLAGPYPPEELPLHRPGFHAEGHQLHRTRRAVLRDGGERQQKGENGKQSGHETSFE